MKYEANVTTMTTYPRSASIAFTSRAKTHNGILRALGKAIANDLRDDAISVRALYVENPFGFTAQVPLSKGDEYQVFLYTRDALFNLMY